MDRKKIIEKQQLFHLLMPIDEKLKQFLKGKEKNNSGIKSFIQRAGLKSMLTSPNKIIPKFIPIEELKYASLKIKKLFEKWYVLISVRKNTSFNSRETLANH